MILSQNDYRNRPDLCTFPPHSYLLCEGFYLVQISLVQLMIREFTRIYTAELLLHHGQFLRRHGLCRVASLEAKAGAEACLTQTHTWPQAWHAGRHSFSLVHQAQITANNA